MPKIHVVLTIARQLEGDTVFVRTEAAYVDIQSADAKVRELMSQYAPNGQQQPVVVETADGKSPCMCLAGGFTVDILDFEKLNEPQST